MVPFRDTGKWGGFEDVRLAIFGSDGFRTCIEGAWPIGAFFRIEVAAAEHGGGGGGRGGDM